MSDPVADMIAAATEYRLANEPPACPECGAATVATSTGRRSCEAVLGHQWVPDTKRGRLPGHVAVRIKPHVPGWGCHHKPAEWVLIEWTGDRYHAMDGRWRVAPPEQGGTRACQPFQAEIDWTRYRRFVKIEPESTMT